jgi:hypothetical protein
LLFDDAAKIGEAFHFFKRLPSSLMGVVLAAFTFSTLLLPGGCSDLFFQFSATALLHLLLVVLEEV